MNKRLILVGAAVVLPILVLAAGLHGLALAQGPAPQGEVGVQSLMGEGFTYQGHLVQGGSPVSGTCSFQFGLWDGSSGPNQVGVTRTIASQAVISGYFTTAPLDFGSGAFNGEARWLAIRVNCGSGYADLGRQAMTPAPYALALPGLWTQQNSTSPNLIGGYSGNAVSNTVVGAAIGGGGASGHPNQASGNFDVVGGGYGNQAAGYNTTIGGGYGNQASGDYTTVGGGFINQAGGYATVGGGYYNQASGEVATVGGGDRNQASGAGAFVGGGGWDGTSESGNQALGNASTIGGGMNNQAGGNYTAIGGGRSTEAGGNYAAVSGGRGNEAGGDYAIIGGGQGNQAVTGTHTMVGGGQGNQASGDYATLGGGYQNQAGGDYATLGAGYQNQAGGDDSTVGGGDQNQAGGSHATVPGGLFNVANGDYSFAAGSRARADSQGCFVWGDSTGSSTTCDVANAFVVRASGGVTIYTTSGAGMGAYLPAGGGDWDSLSDRALKANVVAADGGDVLARLMRVPVSTWNYTSQDPSIRHMGPMAQDFYAAFGLGEDDKHIGTVDADGVALAAIQALAAQNAAQQAEIDALRQQNAALEARLAALEAGK